MYGFPPVPAAVVTLASVSNGCGGGVASRECKYGDDSSFVNTNVPFAGEKVWHVNFREACELHDAGYSGAEVYDGLNGGYYDFFHWTRAQVDTKFLADMREWFTSGQIAYDETVIDGLDHTVDAFLAMMRGETTGKTVVRL